MITRGKRRREEGTPLAYAVRLSKYENKGSCGDREWEDKDEIVESQLDELAELMEVSPYSVVHTGAGISTAAGIADFRGTNGTWTKEKQGHPPPEYERCWDNAVPTLAHMAIKGLVDMGKVQAISSQNVDGLHLRSGVPPALLSELHGNLFQEFCRDGVGRRRRNSGIRGCGAVFMRSCDVGGVGLRETGRRCGRCGGCLRDFALDWEDPLDDAHHERAKRHAEATKAPGGVALCLGSSWQMNHARELPAAADNLVIVNLQATPLDGNAKLVIRATADRVMAGLMRRLNLPIPAYRRTEIFTVAYRLYRQGGRKRRGGCGSGGGNDGGGCG
ncbi:unnamed protein product, partial [Phaeothamnion confervicola]